MVLVQVIIMIVLLLLLVVVVLVVVMLLLGLLLLLLMMVIRVGGFVVAAAVLSLYVIAIHDPCVVGVGNFQSSTLLIIGIYPSRYHENKFSLIRSTGKIKTEEEEAATSYTRMLLLPDDDNDDAHYGCIAVADAAAAAAIAAIIAHHNISSGVYASLLAYFGYTDFFSSTLLFAHVILLTSHTHTVRSWRTMEQKRRFCCRATAIYRADEWSQLPQLLG